MTNLSSLTRLFALAALVAIPSFTHDARADLAPMQQSTTQVMLSTWVNVDCTYLANAEFPKVFVKNTTNATIPKNTYIRYALNGATTPTTVQTSADIPAGKDTSFPGPHLGGQVTCKGSFNAGNPDIVVKNVYWSDANTASVDLANANPWIPTGSFSVRVGSFNCVNSPVKSVDSPLLSLAKGESKTITVAVPKAGATYLQAIADFDKKVAEANENNNFQNSYEFVHCGPA